MYWYEISTYGGLSDYSWHLFEGKQGSRIRGGFTMTPRGGFTMTPRGGTPRWVSEDDVRDTIPAAKAAAVQRLKRMKAEFLSCINSMINELE